MSPSIAAGPGRLGATGSFTQAGVLLVVRNTVGFNKSLSSAGKNVQLFGKQLELKNLTKRQLGLLKWQNAMIGVSDTMLKAAGIAALLGTAIAVGLGIKALQTAKEVQQLTYALQGLVAIELGKRSQAITGILDMNKAMSDAIPVTQELVKGLRDVALTSPIQYEQVFAALRLQIAYGMATTATNEFSAAAKEFGINMTKARFPALQMAEAVAQVGAVLTRDASTFERLNYNLAQAIQKGILTAKNMRELKNAGLDLEEVFKEELNMTLEETREAFKAGEISTEQMSAAFIRFANKYFAPAALNMTRSLQGLINNFQDLWAFAATDLMSPMLEVITARLQDVFDAAEKLLQRGHFEEWGEQLGEATEKVFDFVDAIDHYDVAMVSAIGKTILLGGGIVVLIGQGLKLINVLGAAATALKALGIAGSLSMGALFGIVGAIIAIAGAIFFLIQRKKELEKANRKEAGDILESSESYDDYIDKLRDAELQNYALSESLYDTIRAKEAQNDSFAEGTDVADAIEDVSHEIELLGQKYHQLHVGSTDALMDQKLFYASIQNTIRGFSDLELTIAANEGEVRSYYESVGLMGDRLEFATRLTVALANEEERKRLIEKLSEGQTKNLANAHLAQEQAMKLATIASEELTDSTVTQEKALEALEDTLKTINDSYEQWHEGLLETFEALKDVQDDILDAQQDFADEMEDINDDLSDDLADIAKDYDDALPEATDMEHRVESLVDVWDEWFHRINAIYTDAADENKEQEAGWVQNIIDMTQNTSWAWRQNEETLKGWMLRLKDAYYDGVLPEGFYDENTRQYQEFLEEQDTLRKADEAEATKDYERKKTDAEAELAIAEAEAEQARQDALLLGALTLADATDVLDQWAQDTFGAMAFLYDTPQAVFDALKTGALTVDPVLQGIITNYSAGIQTALNDTAAVADDTKGTLEEALKPVNDLATKDIPALRSEYENLKNITEGPFAAGMDPEELQTMKDRMVELEQELENYGLTMGEAFDTAPTDMEAKVTGLFAAIKEELAALIPDTEGVAEALAGVAENISDAFHDAYFGESVVPDTYQAIEDMTTAWDEYLSHMTLSLATTQGTVKGLWSSTVGAIKRYLNTLHDNLDDVANKLDEIRKMSPIKVTIEIKVESSPAVSLSQGTENVLDLYRALVLVADTNWRTTVHVDLGMALEAGVKLGNAIVAVQSALSTGGEGTHGRWWDFTKNLQVPAKRLAGLASFFAGIFDEEGIAAYETRLGEIDKLLKEHEHTEEERNRLIAERNKLEAEHIQQQETLARIEEQKADLDFLNRQVELLEMIRNHNLNAREILGDITLGIDASAGELMTVTSRALEALIVQINNQLKIASPSQVMMDVGRHMMEGMGLGIMEAARIPMEAAAGAAIAPVVAAAGAGSTTNVTLNSTINSGMDQVVFENRVLDIIKRGVRGY